MGNSIFSDVENADQLPVRVLAYIGDGVFELYVRKYFLMQGLNIGPLHDSVISVVNAESQHQILRSLSLTEEEQEFIRRARNKKMNLPKGIKASSYRYSTALEAFLGYLYLSGNNERLREIIIEIIGYIQRRNNETE